MKAHHFHPARPSFRTPLAIVLAALLCASASTASAWAPAPSPRAVEAPSVARDGAPNVAVRGVPAERIVRRRAAPARPAIVMAKASVGRALR